MSQDPSATNPFHLLGIAPTLDAAAVKRAYFDRLKKVQPHQDADGFLALRRAYEEVASPAGLASAFMVAPCDLGEACRDRISRAAALVEQGRQRLVEQGGSRALVSAFVKAARQIKI